MCCVLVGGAEPVGTGDYKRPPKYSSGGDTPADPPQYSPDVCKRGISGASKQDTLRARDGIQSKGRKGLSLNNCYEPVVLQRHTCAQFCATA